MPPRCMMVSAYILGRRTMPGIEDCLIRNLLYASVQTYHREPGYGGTPRWIEGPVRIEGEGDRRAIDLALACTFREGIVVAFRGTLPPLDISPDLKRIVRPDAAARAVAADWINNVHLGLVPLDREPIVMP